MTLHTVVIEDVPVTTFETETFHVLKLTSEEYNLLIGGIGATSMYSRKKAGMTPEQVQFFGKLYHDLTS